MFGNYNNPIPFLPYNIVERGLFYSSDGITKYYCLCDGIPDSVSNTQYFLQESILKEAIKNGNQSNN